MKVLALIAMLFFLEGNAHAAAVILDWDASNDSDLAGYKVYYQADTPSLPFQGTGAVEGAAPIDVANVLTETVSGLDSQKTYYFAVTAYNSAGLESVYSNIIMITPDGWDGSIKTAHTSWCKIVKTGNSSTVKVRFGGQ